MVVLATPPFMFTIEYDGAAIQAGHRYSKMVVASGSRTGDEERHSQD